MNCTCHALTNASPSFAAADSRRTRSSGRRIEQHLVCDIKPSRQFSRKVQYQQRKQLSVFVLQGRGVLSGKGP
jgi:hypothetical protein